MVERRVLLGVSWQSGVPHIRIRDDNEAASRLEPLLNFNLAYRADIDSPKVCVGHKPFRSGGPDYVDCRQSPQPGGATCRACAIVEATFASNLHHAHTKESIGVDPDIAAHLQQSNLLYLAAFRDGSIKVGTSTERRIETRLIEQGAWKALVVARATDGVAVRVLEDAITAVLGLRQSVSATRKLTGLVTPVADSDLAETLEHHRATVHQMLAEQATTAITRDAFTPLAQEWHHPGTDDERWANVHQYSTSLKAGAHDLRVDAVCGRLAMLRKPEGSDRFVADLRPLFGLILDWGHFGSQPLTVQDTLF